MSSTRTQTMFGLGIGAAATVPVKAVRSKRRQLRKEPKGPAGAVVPSGASAGILIEPSMASPGAKGELSLDSIGVWIPEDLLKYVLCSPGQRLG